jgi:hypothetical protein
MYFIQILVPILTLGVILWAIFSLRTKAEDLKKEIEKEDSEKEE